MPDHETARFGMPLLQPAQAQKHVTVNEALMRLDASVNLVIQSVSQVSPPLAVLAGHKRQLEDQLADLVANLDEVKAHEKEARALLAKVEAQRPGGTSPAKGRTKA